MNIPLCRNQQRREDVRRDQELNGLDFLEVGTDRLTLTVYFLGKAPVELSPSNVIIEGGKRVRGIRVVSVTVRRTKLAELDDYMEVVTDREGDFSTYTLRVVGKPDDQGNWKRHLAFDSRYDRVEFNFKVDCPSDLDCKQEAPCPPELLSEPEIDYLAKDYASFRRLILDRLALVMPDWKERHVPDLGITLVELLAYVGDHLSYYQDAVATEAYLDTARKRVSVRRHVRLVDYPMHEGCNARTWICVATDSPLTIDDPDSIYFITKMDRIGAVITESELLDQSSGAYEVFEPVIKQKIKLYAGQHEIHFYSWGDSECCVPRGATTATLVGRWNDASPSDQSPECDPEVPNPLAPQAASSDPENTQMLGLEPGDVLIFEEVVGPKTGNRADADPKHRHAVRLIDIRHGFDPLHPEIALTEISWAEEDALPFPLCLSSMGPPPACEVIQSISVARGNIILVDHGITIHEDLDPVPLKESRETCDCLGGLADTMDVPDHYEPVLRKAPLTFSQPFEQGKPAALMLLQDPRESLSQVTSLTGTAPDGLLSEWTVRRDLLASRSRDFHFVVETDDKGKGHLRFGDGDLGTRPAAKTQFDADYRVGNGPAGNVGMDTICHMVTRNFSLSGGITAIRNPLAAVGGTAPEPLPEIKLYAPHAFRSRLQRAITPGDYAAIVMREFPDKVQGAVAQLRWNGSWYEILVAVDPLGQEQADPGLLKRIEERLYRYGRIAHDIAVHSAQRVALDIELMICVKPDYLRGHVKAALLEVLSNRQFADGRRGFFHPDNLRFGEGLYLSRLIATAQAVPGVESVTTQRFERLFEGPNHEIENGVLALGPLEVARLDNDPSLPENGRLTLDLRGGR